MTEEKRVLHLIREPRLPSELGTIRDCDTAVFLSGLPGGGKPNGRCIDISTSEQGGTINAESLLSLIFEHDVVMPW